MEPTEPTPADPAHDAAPSGETMSFAVEGMTCAACVGRVERSLRKVSGVTDASVNLATERATVRVQSTSDLRPAIASALDNAGYKALFDPDRAAAAAASPTDVGEPPSTPSPSESVESRRQLASERERLRLIAAVSLSVPLAMLAMVPGLAFAYSPWVQAALAFAVLVLPGWPLLHGAWKGVRHASPNMDTLVSLGSVAAFSYSLYELFRHGGHHGGHVYFETAGMIVTLVLLGRFLEARARRRAGDAIRALAAMQPRVARVVRDGREEELPVERVRRGDVLRVGANERVPTDGTILEGETRIDESMLSGEPMPVPKKPGDAVTGVSVNGPHPFTMRATRVGSDTVYAHIVKLVENAQASKPPVQRLVDRVSAVFVPVVIGLAIATFVLAYFVARVELTESVLRAIAVLVISCPCALGLATPTAIIAGTGRAAELGVLVRDSEGLELAGSVTHVVFDKTGTLTVGMPAVRVVESRDDTDPSLWLAAAASVERDSEHPLARAILNEAKRRSLTLQAASEVEALAGTGIRGRVEGAVVEVGRVGVPASGATTDDEAWLASRLDALGRDALTAAVVRIDGRVMGVLGIADPLRETSSAAVASLRARGIEVHLLSGDRQQTARAIGESVGIAAEHVRAEVLPANKAQYVAALRARGRVVAMVGDGVNDAPALAAADVGFAMGSGTDAAINAAAVTLMRSDPTAVVQAIGMSRRTMRTIRENLIWALGYNIVMIPVAALGLLQAWGGPMLASAAMALSSISVVSNSLRLRRADPSESGPRPPKLGLLPF